ncbi:MAG TPA: M1 family metallopeptidase [Candidatus Methylomirabilis sp.]|nr:M1 family metallopeptidase [Candidatus Methylomirabilis sp.]
MKRLFITAGLSLLVCSAVPAQRLPDNVVPDSYDLKFVPDLGSATFSGEETIHAHMQKSASSIVLNSAEIEIKEASIASPDYKQAASFTTDDTTETATITVPGKVPAGPVDIYIRYTGILNDKLRGFYLSQTARRRYAVTQFEATDARRAFPCFDEPAYKAVFRISLVVDRGDTAISNGKIISDTPGPGDGKHTLRFSDTPKMSSYLAAMMVGDFACIEGGADGIPIRVCAVPEKKNLLSFALLSAENILKFYDNYYETKYPFQKLDIIAFPDFAAGAMENTAAITYRETLLTIDDKTASVDAHQAVVGVLAHEMAHMWFGDLVTMKWWDDVWLNEGFATWMSSKPGEAWKPEWHGELDEILGTNGALGTDTIASVRPIRAKAETRAEIETLFDGIAYGKAAAVLRMVEAYVGPEVFRKGVNAYLEKHAYGNATAEDFWNQMAATSGKPVDQIMSGFTQQPGAPLIVVKSACSQKKQGRFKKTWTTQVTLAQQRYFADASKLDSGSQELWQVPVSLRPAGARNATYVLLAGRQQTFDLPGCAPWVYADAGGRGYYHSDYDSATLAKMSAELETSFSPEERMRFLDDVWAMVDVGHLRIGDYLDTLDKMKSERTRALVDEMTGYFRGIHDRIAAPADRVAFEKWVRDFLRPIADELGETAAPGESDDKRALRADIFATLAAYGRDPQLLEKSRALAEEYMHDPNSVDAGLAGNALEVSALIGDSGLYDQYMQHLKTAKTPEEYYNYFGALGRFPSPELARRTFEFALSPDVKNQDLGLIFGPLSNPNTQDAAWELLKANYDAIVTKAGTDLGGGLADAAGLFCDEKLRDDAQEFFASKNMPGTERMLANARDRVNACIQLRSLQRANLSTYLNRAVAAGAH